MEIVVAGALSRGQTVPMRSVIPAVGLTCAFAFLYGATASRGSEVLSKPKLFQSLTEPPCSYCSTQNRKNLIRPDDPVLAWLRGAHNGGAFPLRHFIAAPRVIYDT